VVRPYVGNAKTWVTGLMEKATSPKAEPVAARPARPAGARRTGQLIAQSEPAGAKVLVDGKERGVTPLTLDDMSFGSHTVVIQSDKGSVRRTIKMPPIATPSSANRYSPDGSSLRRSKFRSRRRARHPARRERQGVVVARTARSAVRKWRPGVPETRHVEVQPAQTTSLSLVTSPSTITVTASAPAVVAIDGQPVGETPLTNHPIALGTRDIVARAPTEPSGVYAESHSDACAHRRRLQP
jgi:hypothetical protein